MDILFRNATVFDGSGKEPFVGDVAIDGDRISHVWRTRSRLPEVRFQTEIDLNGLALAPGFIDVHTHDDRALIDQPDLPCKTSQGVTTVVTGNCGISIVPARFDGGVPPPPMNLLGGADAYAFPSMASYSAALEKSPPATNVVALVGHCSLRVVTMDNVDRPASSDEITEMRSLLLQCMEEGASGFSTGLFYAPNAAADMREVVAIASAVADHSGIYTTHMRDEGDHVLESIDESLRTAAAADLPLVVSHHKCTGSNNWGRTEETVPILERAGRSGGVNLDVYPYVAGSTILTERQADADCRILVTWSEAHPEMAGKELTEIAAEWGMTCRQAAGVLQPAGAIYFQMHEDDVQRVLQSRIAMIGSDGIPGDRHPHPRLWGTFPRVIGRYARDLGLFTISEAIRKMTKLPATVFGLLDRGSIRQGAAADLVIFDPSKIIDRATFENPIALSEGIVAVYVNGVETFRDGKSAGRTGRLLRRNRPSD